MSAYVAGDADALRQLYERLAPVVLGVARRKLGSEADARDVVQWTFLHLHRARFDFRADRALRPWLFTITMNLIREQFRRVARRREDLGDGEVPDGVEGVDAMDADEARRVRAAVRALPELQREVIELHWFEELSFPEVAVIVGASVSAVKVRAHRGYLALREALAAEQGR